MSKVGRASETVMVRFPEGMKDRIRELADENHRSMNSEIVVRLERTIFDDFTMKEQDSRPSAASGQLAPVSA